MRKIAIAVAVVFSMFVVGNAFADGYGMSSDWGSSVQNEGFTQSGSWMGTTTNQDLQNGGVAAIFGVGSANFTRIDEHGQTYLYTGTNTSGVATQTGNFGGNDYQTSTVKGAASDPANSYAGYCVGAKQWSTSAAEGNGTGTATSGWSDGALTQTANQTLSGSAVEGTVSGDLYSKRVDGYDYKNVTPAAEMKEFSQGTVEMRTVASGPSVYTSAIAGQGSEIEQFHQFGPNFGGTRKQVSRVIMNF